MKQIIVMQINVGLKGIRTKDLMETVKETKPAAMNIFRNFLFSF